MHEVAHSAAEPPPPVRRWDRTGVGTLKSAILLLLVLAACGSGRRELRRSESETVPPSSVDFAIVTFNVRDLFVADRRRERMRAIGRELGRLRPDVVALQEAFASAPRTELKSEPERTSGTTYKAMYFPSGVMGSGLFVLTPHAIDYAGLVLRVRLEKAPRPSR